MSRAADYTIKGFLYQFTKTLLEILKSPDESIITVEGIVEDIDVTTPSKLRAIQCKYHEASQSFTPSSTFKPLLQMMHHFHTNSEANIEYILFAYFPKVDQVMPPPTIGKTDLQDALISKNKDLKQIIASLQGKVDIDRFLTRFNLEFGPPFDALVDQAHSALKDNGVPADDVDILADPNAVYLIASLSAKHDPAERKITKLELLNNLRNVRKTAISRWTLALNTRKKLLDARRAQLKAHLDQNARLRYLLVDAESLADYDEEIVLFMTDYLRKYHFKEAHTETPVLCLRSSVKNLNEIEHRLYERGFLCATGVIGGQFEQSHFLRDPLHGKGTGGAIKREFSLRLLCWNDHGSSLNAKKCEDMFIIGEADFPSLDTSDVNVERLGATSLKEVKYLMGVSNAYE